MFGHAKINDLTPQQVHALLEAGEILLIDVREPAEFAAERIHGALNYPLSTFDPTTLPRNDQQLVVMQCGSGKRSLMAANQCQKIGLDVENHLAGGLIAWREAGLPTIILDADTGALSETG